VLYGLYLSGSGARVENVRQDVIANNLANADTVSFKRQLAIFRERLPEVKEDNHLAQTSIAMLERIGGGAMMEGTFTQFAQGPLQKTGGSLDVALTGPGFMVVGNGQEQFLTRDGRIEPGQDGELMVAGKPVLGVGRSPIRIDPQKPVEIAPDGSIRQGEKTVGRLLTVNVGEPEKLQAHGKGLYRLPADGRTQPAQTLVRQGYLEQSAVQPLKELVALIESQRTFEANINMMKFQDTTLGRLVNDVPRVG
jgi:flagellar basal body rod protein FlgG